MINFKNDGLYRFQAYTIDNQTGGANDPIGAERYRLDIDIGSITFFHHHLMSVEHVFAMRMKQMYENYVIRRQQRRVQQLNDRVRFKHVDHRLIRCFILRCRSKH